jgi:hypothetical protein
MNLTCSTAPGSTDTTTPTVWIYINWPGGTMPDPPENSTAVVPPDGSVNYQIVGYLPNGHPFPNSPYSLNGANVAVYVSND